MSCIQSSFVSFLKLQKILNYTPHCGQCFDGHKKKPLGNCLWEEGARVGGEGGGQAFWSAVSQNPQISQNHLLSASNAGPGFRLISNTSYRFSFQIPCPTSKTKTRFKRQSNRRRQQQDNAQHQIEQNRFSLSVSNQLLVFLFRHCFRSSFFHVLFVSVCIFRFKNLALTTVIFTCLFFFCFCCVLFSSFLSALLSAFCFCSPNFRHTFQIIFASYILKYNNRSFYHY